MKKLITAAMTLALAAGLASAQVESANIVGYTTQALPTEQQIIIGMPFQNVGGGPVDLQDIVVSGVAANGGTFLWWWNKDTRLYTRAYWVELYDALGAPVGVDGWGDQVDWIAIDKSFAAGEGFWIQAPAGASVTVAGELVTATGDQPYLGIALPAEQQIQLTNPMPVESTDLQSITMDGVPADATTGLWWWNKDTGIYTRAYWVELYDEFGSPVGGNGWGDFLSWEAIDKTFAAGEGFWIKAPAGATVRFENPLYVAP